MKKSKGKDNKNKSGQPKLISPNFSLRKGKIKGETRLISI